MAYFGERHDAAAPRDGGHRPRPGRASRSSPRCPPGRTAETRRRALDAAHVAVGRRRDARHHRDRPEPRAGRGRRGRRRGRRAAPPGLRVSLAIREADGRRRPRDATPRSSTPVSPEDPTSVAELRWSDATYPGGLRLLAELDGGRSGPRRVGRIYVHPPEFRTCGATLDVLADARRQGVGTALLTPDLGARRGRGQGRPPHPGQRRPARSRSSSCVHRGFDGARADDGAPARPRRARAARGRRARRASTLTTLAERPGPGRPASTAVALEAFADIPGGDEPMTVGDLAEFRARDVDRDVDPGRGVLRRARRGDRGRRRLRRA